MIISGADDRKIKLWKYFDFYFNNFRYSETKAWEHDSLYGHTNNVSSVAFHAKLDVIISNSEDKTTRIWDLNKRT